MNELTQKTVLELLEWVKQGKEFLIEQAPLYVQELIKLTIAKGLIFGVPLIATSVFAAITIFKASKKLTEKHDDSDCYLINILSIILLIPFCVGVDFLWTALTAWLAPRVFLVEYLSGLGKQ